MLRLAEPEDEYKQLIVATCELCRVLEEMAESRCKADHPRLQEIYWLYRDMKYIENLPRVIKRRNGG